MAIIMINGHEVPIASWLSLAASKMSVEGRAPSDVRRGDPKAAECMAWSRCKVPKNPGV